MGISSMPTPRDNLLVFMLYSLAVSIAFLMNLVQAVLVFLGLAARDDMEERPVLRIMPTRPSLSDRFRTKFRPSQFGRRHDGTSASMDCRVCLARFEPESVVDQLPCGHLFHRACLETWLDCNHATCPLCRLYLLPASIDLPVLEAAAGPAPPHLVEF
ncbi:hypothetical protein U9M48_038435 [Paspalum notatum var. saurae]|uniref:RING-type domain-containing protein n=1 Tax=Paspalum notatum var. saurae TaxID=547442 RepID=A0AAQ3ULB6_PASNO